MAERRADLALSVEEPGSPSEATRNNCTDATKISGVMLHFTINVSRHSGCCCGYRDEKGRTVPMHVYEKWKAEQVLGPCPYALYCMG